MPPAPPKGKARSAIKHCNPASAPKLLRARHDRGAYPSPLGPMPRPKGLILLEIMSAIG